MTNNNQQHNKQIYNQQKNNQNNKALFLEGLKDGIPIGAAYFAVAFSLGIAARSAGISAIQGLVASLICSASAGQYAGFTLIASQAAYFEIILVSIVANARYLLMSCSLSQRLSPNLGLGHRMLLGFYLTDELFGITIAKPGYVNPIYTYGAILVASPCWGLGTFLGIIFGNILPAKIVTALGVALFGMFLGIIIPPAKDSKPVLLVVAASFVFSGIWAITPALSNISSGFKTIILTVVISAVAAIIFPKEDEPDAAACEPDASGDFKNSEPNAPDNLQISEPDVLLNTGSDTKEALNE